MRKIQADGLILAGGKGKRMGGIYKGALVYQKETFIQRLVNILKKETTKLYISYGTEHRGNFTGCELLFDRYSDIGAIGGLLEGFSNGSEEWMLVAACDMPFLEGKMYQYLWAALESASENYIGVVPVMNGKIHPLAAIYRKSMAETLKKQIEKKNYCLMDALKQEKILYVSLPNGQGFEKMLENINTPKEYEALRRLEEKWV